MLHRASRPSASLGYELDILDELGKPTLAVAGRLRQPGRQQLYIATTCARRRFLASQAIQIYNGQCLGAGAVVIHADPGRFCGWVDAVVIVKCHLKDDDAEEVEVLEIPSGCVRRTRPPSENENGPFSNNRHGPATPPIA
eukprot:Skav215270  [mRNA]  locus=scaffold2881:122714:127914:+ [translate_table: standard]